MNKIMKLAFLALLIMAGVTLGITGAQSNSELSNTLLLGVICLVLVDTQY